MEHEVVVTVEAIMKRLQQKIVEMIAFFSYYLYKIKVFLVFFCLFFKKNYNILNMYIF